MRALRYFKVAAGLILIFGAGAVTGGVITHQVIKHQFEQALNFDRWKAGVMHVLQSRLNLTPDQRVKVEFLVDHRGREIRDCFGRAFNESGHALVRLQCQIDQELTPQQREIHARMKKEFRADVKKRFDFDLPDEPASKP